MLKLEFLIQLEFLSVNLGESFVQPKDLMQQSGLLEFHADDEVVQTSAVHETYKGE